MSGLGKLFSGLWQRPYQRPSGPQPRVCLDGLGRVCGLLTLMCVPLAVLSRYCCYCTGRRGRWLLRRRHLAFAPPVIAAAFASLTRSSCTTNALLKNTLHSIGQKHDLLGGCLSAIFFTSHSFGQKPAYSKAFEKMPSLVCRVWRKSKRWKSAAGVLIANRVAKPQGAHCEV